MKTMRTALTGALVAFSTGSMAQGSSAVKLNDAELDQITAGSGAISGVLIFNRGEGPGEAKINGNHTTCVNCVDPGVPVPRTSGFVTVVTPHGKLVTHPIRQAPFSF